MSTITKEDIMRFSAKYFQNNYTVIYKRTGDNDKSEKVQKPEIHPVEVNRDDQSDYLKTMFATNTKEIQPRFLDFDKDIQKSSLKKGIQLLYVPNTINQLFSVYYKYDFGTNSNPKLELAKSYQINLLVRFENRKSIKWKS